MKQNCRAFCLGFVFLLASATVVFGQDWNSQALRETMDSLIHAKNVGRLDYVVVDSDQVIANGRLTNGVDRSDDFRVGSLGKTIVALGIMKLVDAGALRLEDPVALHLPNLKVPNQWESTDPLRLVHLLEHTSGLDEMHFRDFFRRPEDVGISLEKLMAGSIGGYSVRWKPGTVESYSNINYAIAAALIEAVTHQTASEWLNATILLPLGMTHSYFADGRSRQKEVVEAYKWMSTDDYREYRLYPAVGFISSAYDLGKLVQFFLRKGRVDSLQIISEQSISRMQRVETTSAARCGMPEGRGIGLNVVAVPGGPLIYNSGSVEGASALFDFFPRQGFGFAMMLNRGPLSSELDRFEIPMVQFLMRNATRIDSLHFDTLKCAVADVPRLGYYRLANPRNQLFAFVDFVESGVWLQPSQAEYGTYELERIDGQRIPIGLANGQHPPRWHDDHLGLQFQDENGNEVLQYSTKYYQAASAFWPMFFRGGLWLLRIIRIFGLMAIVGLLVARLLKKSFAKDWLKIALIVNMPYWCAHFGYMMLASGDYYALGRFGIFSGLLLLLSLLLMISTLWGTWRVIKTSATKQARYFKGLFSVMVISNWFLMGYLIAFGMLPFASWMY
jgi:CubicO group peptidase (beta-lactamase class C family)